ncbi:hypothetical protein FOZ62_027747, partial [Perkinsus olseni]
MSSDKSSSSDGDPEFMTTFTEVDYIRSPTPLSTPSTPESLENRPSAGQRLIDDTEEVPTEPIPNASPTPNSFLEEVRSEQPSSRSVHEDSKSDTLNSAEVSESGDGPLSSVVDSATREVMKDTPLAISEVERDRSECSRCEHYGIILEQEGQILQLTEERDDARRRLEALKNTKTRLVDRVAFLTELTNRLQRELEEARATLTREAMNSAEVVVLREQLGLAQEEAQKARKAIKRLPAAEEELTLLRHASRELQEALASRSEECSRLRAELSLAKKITSKMVTRNAELEAAHGKSQALAEDQRMLQEKLANALA